jgi:hypothetical protein
MKMPKYDVTARWEHTETRIITAKSPGEAAQKVAEGEYDDIREGWNLTGFIGIDHIEKVKPQ